jgi:hypothetical protein
MRRRSVSLACVGVVTMLLVGGLVSAGNGVAIKLNVPFNFTVNGMEMSSGRYEFRLDGSDRPVLAIVDPRGGRAKTLPVTARLADQGASTVQVVKDTSSDRYSFRLDGPDQAVLAIVDASEGGSTALPVMTRLADLGSNKVQIVFDVADGRHYLSEIHVPGADGFAFEGAPGKHTHATVSGQ